MAIGDLFRIPTGLAGVLALNAFKKVNASLGEVQVKLSTGRELNQAADNPANLTLSTALNARSRGLAVALNNVGLAKNVLLTAEGSLESTHEVLLRMKSLVLRGRDDSNGPLEKASVAAELRTLVEEMDDTVNETITGDRRLLDGSYVGVVYQVGENPGDVLRMDIGQDHSASGLGVDIADVADKMTGTLADTAQALDSIANAIERVLDTLQTIGTRVVRLGIQESNLMHAITNTSATESRLTDADLARKQLDSVKLQISQQLSGSTLAQAAFAPRQVLALFQ